MARASCGWPAWVRLPATVSAAPTDACAVRARPAGNPAGRAPVSRLGDSGADTLPITAPPRGPPTRRVASLTADPTPDFAFGTTPMIASVAGALVSPIPVPSTTIWAAIVP